MNENKENSKSLVDHLEEDDWAIIIGNDGELKGVFIPDSKNEELVPHAIVKIMSDYFGVDFNEDGPTVH